MESTPPSHQSEPQTRTKSAARLSKMRQLAKENEMGITDSSLDIVPSSPKLDFPSPANARQLRELLLNSPSPVRRSKSRLAERLELADDAVEPNGARKRCKTKNVAMGASPRNNRKSKRRIEQDLREDKDLDMGDEMMVKPRKKKNVVKSKKEKIQLVQSSKTIDDEVCNVDRILETINDLIMWKDVSKSSLWFGVGSLGFLSSCFSRTINYSIFSMLSQLGFLFLVVSFFSNLARQREGTSRVKRELKLNEDDILKFGRMILPAANLAISAMAKLFSGEPAMTLKVVPFLILGGEYGHLITLWRLFALGFLFSFTVPKLYSLYSVQIENKVEHTKSWMLEAWRACSHKKIVAASAVTAFLNLSSIKTRIFAAFIGFVVVTYRSQYSEAVKIEEETVEDVQMDQQEKTPEDVHDHALVVVEGESKK